MEYAAEITYPMPEATSSGMLNCAAQVRWHCQCRGRNAIHEEQPYD